MSLVLLPLFQIFDFWKSKMSLKISKTIYTSAFVFGLLSASYKSFKVLKSENNEKDVRRVSVFFNVSFVRRSRNHANSKNSG